MPLQKRFSNLLLNYTEDTNLIASLWNDINTRYNEKHRAYHNLTHLKELFIQFDLYKNKLENPNTIAFAIFYHDIIYNIWSKKNEEKSADFAVNKLNGIINASQLKEIYNHIITTKTHNATTNDAKWLVDFDLVILGQSQYLYSQYVAMIRKEYKAVPNFIYKNGRKKVLHHFINKPFIYATDKFRKLYEIKAKQNLHHELKPL